MKFKKIYVEITNFCNLDCLFCPGNTRDKQFIEIDKFKAILKKLEGYTKYLYFHLMGEPLLHPEINKLIDLASTNYFVNITTNGYLINRIADNSNIRQINISLQAFDSRKNVTLEEYLSNVLNSVEKLEKKGTIINYRFWVDNNNAVKIKETLEKYYNIKIEGNTKIRDNIFVDYQKEFIWPDETNNYQEENGSCRALIDHIGILVDGTVVPCCLDYNGKINLGNIYKNDLKEILNSERVNKMRDGFKKGKKIEKMCQHCNFYDRIGKQQRR